uniref:Uncharacterized protein n=1 Tax=Parascaris univalens TaxID=6257 RepID=A0A915BQZ5_PARUN
MFTSSIIFVVILFEVRQTNALHCLVVRPGHGLISEKCPRLAVACRVRIEKNSIVWYENKLYDRNRLACVLQSEYGSGKRSGCVRKPSGAVRCWCYGQSNCNNPENSRKLYKAFVKGDEAEFNRIIDEIETSDVSDYNYAEPLLNINEPIDLNESDEVQSSSHTQSLSELRIQSAAQPRNKPNERSSENVEPSTTARPKSFERHGHKFTHESAERFHKVSRHTTTAMIPAETAITTPFKAPVHVASDPRIRPTVGRVYEASKDRDMLSDRKQQNSKFYTEPLDTVRALPTDQTPRGPKRVDPRAQHKSEQQKRYEAIELPNEADQQQRIMKGTSSRICSPLVLSLLIIWIFLF